ncbi:MAG: glycosyltransferase family 39 protein [Pseudomonadales bacterium]|nr:glycosyltransferase family 39 protein [Pseudomonadales bacterium]
MQQRFSISHILVAAALLALAWFATISTHGLYDPDEGRYAEIPREMAASGDWITPRLNGIKYFEKPPLQYWATAAVYSLTGPTVWASRVWVLLTGLAGVFLTFWLVARLYGQREAIAAAALQAGALLYAGCSQLNTLDMGFTFTLQIALAGLACLILARDESLRQRWGPWLLAIGTTLAFLSKGLAGILIPGAVTVLYIVIRRDWGLILRAKPWLTLGCLLVLAGPWIWLVTQRNPEFPGFFFVHEHFARFLTRVHARYEPAWFFLPVLLLGLLPWTPLLPWMGKLWRRPPQGEGNRDAVLLFSLWAGFVLLFFSASQSKLIPYILPMFPALSALGALALAQDWMRRARLTLGSSAVFWGLLALASTIGLFWPQDGALLREALGQAASGAVLLLWFLTLVWGVSAWIAGRGRPLAGLWAAALGTMVFASRLLWVGEASPPRIEQTTVLNEAGAHISANTRLFCVDTYVQSAPFQFHRPCQLVRYRGELDFGLTQQPELWIEDLESFAAQWQAQADAVAFVSPKTLAQLQQLNLSIGHVISQPSLVAITRK